MQTRKEFCGPQVSKCMCVRSHTNIHIQPPTHENYKELSGNLTEEILWIRESRATEDKWSVPLIPAEGGRGRQTVNSSQPRLHSMVLVMAERSREKERNYQKTTPTLTQCFYQWRNVGGWDERQIKSHVAQGSLKIHCMTKDDLKLLIILLPLSRAGSTCTLWVTSIHSLRGIFSLDFWCPCYLEWIDPLREITWYQWGMVG